MGPLSFSPDGATLASGSYDTTIRIWDVETGEELKTLSGHTDWVNSLAFSPDGKTLASGGWDHTVRLWDLASGNELGTFPPHSSLVRAVAFQSGWQDTRQLGF